MGNSITDGLKSRLTQYLKHVVEDDVLFTNSNPLHTPPFWLNIVLDVPKLKITQTHIPHTYTSQIIFFVLFTSSVRVNNPWPNAICFVLKVQNCHLVSLIVLVLQWMLKWSKRVSLRSVSFTNYPTLHHPLLSTFLFFFFSFFFYMFTNFTHHQILQYTKDTKSNTHKISVTQIHTKIIHSRIFTKYCSMFHNFTSDQQFTSYKILSLLFPMIITIHQRHQNVSNNDDTFSKSAQNSLPWVLPDKYITDWLTNPLILSLPILLIPPIHE